MSAPLKRPRRKPFSAPAPLSDDEREKLRAILNNDVFRLALARVQNMKPSAFTAAPGVQGANDRLHEIKGWELYEHALFLQAETPKQKSERPTETYPDQGLIDHE